MRGASCWLDRMKLFGDITLLILLMDYLELVATGP